MHVVSAAHPASSRVSPKPLRSRLSTALTAAALPLLLSACSAGGSASLSPVEAAADPAFAISPAAPRLAIGERLLLQVHPGNESVVWESLDAEVAKVDSLGRVVGMAAGVTGVVAHADGHSDTVRVAVASSGVVAERQWRIDDDGTAVEIENGVLRLRFGYAAAGVNGWFTGGESSGGGGSDGGIVELYYKPTSETRNLVFRNGQWGSLYDQMDLYEAEEIAADRADHDAPDFGSGRDARMISHRVYESAGRVVAEFEFDFRAWRIRRTYLVYPWGDITVHARVTQREAGRYNYLSHRFLFAASRARITDPVSGATLDWGTHFQADREMLHAWSDGAPAYEYVEPVRDAVDRNTVLYEQGRSDAYSGFMLDDRNGNDPDIVVMNGDRRIAESPFHTVSSRFGGKQYVESALFSPRWAPDALTHADMTWFYLGTPCCEVRWSDSPLWQTSLGSWEESFHVLLRRNLDPADYLALWRARAAELEAGRPTGVIGGSVRLDAADRLHHVTALEDAAELSWSWRRPAGADRPVDYRTAFVVEGFVPAEVRIEGAGAPGIVAYRDVERGETLVVLVGEQPAEAAEYRIVLSR